MSTFFDAHIHLDFVSDASDLALFAGESERFVMANTVSPYGFMKMQMRFPGNPWVVPALGFHPWWVASNVLQPADLQLFEHLAPQAPFVGEVGLDFMGGRKQSAQDQLDAFDRIIEACAQPLVCPPAAEGFKRVISLHSARAAMQVLDVLERWDVTRDNACIFHWFSGSSDELQRAIGLGCFFSVGPRMLGTKKGAEYVKAIPADHLIFETDDPGKIDPAAWDSVCFTAEAPIPDPRVIAQTVDEWRGRLAGARAVYERVTGRSYDPEDCTLKLAIPTAKLKDK